MLGSLFSILGRFSSTFDVVSFKKRVPYPQKSRSEIQPVTSPTTNDGKANPDFGIADLRAIKFPFNQ